MLPSPNEFCGPIPMESHLARPLKRVSLNLAKDTLLSSGTRQFAIWGENNPSSLSIPFLAIGLIAAGDSARNVKYPQTACPHVSFRPQDLIGGYGIHARLHFVGWSMFCHFHHACRLGWQLPGRGGYLQCRRPSPSLGRRRRFPA